MLPPVLEIYAIWHPHDETGKTLAHEFVEHFRGASFSGVVGGGIHVSMRSTGWQSSDSAPQPLNTHSTPGPNRVQPAEYIAIIPILGLELASAVQDMNNPWRAYVEQLVQQQANAPDYVGIFPYLLDKNAIDQTELGNIFSAYQRIATGDPAQNGDTPNGLRCRDLSQGIAQLLSPDEMDRLTVFLSHTKRHSNEEGEDVDKLVALTREAIANTRLAEFFDARDLQPGCDWDAELRSNAGRSALLSIRTDLYASREWCQREISIAKKFGMPVVTLDAIGHGEERGSFLMDHVPRIPARKAGTDWRREDVLRGLNLLTDECLKRAIWLRQKNWRRRQGTKLVGGRHMLPNLLHW